MASFAYVTKGFHLFTVPAIGSQTDMLVELWGAHGGAPSSNLASKPGYLKFVVKNVANKEFKVRVGGSTTNSTGGFNGGGATTSGQGYGGGGGTALTCQELFLLNLDFLACAAGGGGCVNTDSITMGGYGGGVLGGRGSGTILSSGRGAALGTGGQGGKLSLGTVDPDGESFGPASSAFPAIGTAKVGGTGFAAGGGAGYAGGGGGGNYTNSPAGAGGGSSGIVNAVYTMELIENRENASNRPQTGTLLDGCAIIRAYDAATAPTVTILTPTTGQNFKVNNPINLLASATGNLSVQANAVSWYANNQFIGNGLSLAWTPTTQNLGSVTLLCQVSDINSKFATDSVPITVVNLTTPSISITNPVADSTNEQSMQLTCTGIALDTFYGDISSSIIWTSPVNNQVLGFGSPITIPGGTLPLGTQKIQAAVTNNDGRRNETSVSVTILSQTKTVINIITPTRNLFSFGETFIATAVATTKTGQDVSSSIKWILPNGIMLSNTASINVNTMLFAQNTPLTLTAQVLDGVDVREDMLVFTVSSDPLPSIIIDSPFEFGVYFFDNSIIFSAIANDFPSQDISNQISWTSSIDGVLAVNAASFSKKLSVGIHAVTARVESSLGPIEAVVNFKVEVPKFALVSILTPLNGDVFELNQLVTFTGAALSNTLQDISNSIGWFSDLQGFLGTGSTISVPLIHLGDYTITANVVDPDGITANTSIVITVASNPCIRRGSTVATATSNIPIEDLNVGMQLIDWRGNQVELLANIALPRKSREFIRIPANSLGSAIPDQHVYIRPGHAILVQGKELPCEVLIGSNGITKVYLDLPDDIFTLITHQKTFVLIDNLPVATWSKSAWDIEQELRPFCRATTNIF